MSQLKLFRDSLPKKPYCTDDLEHGLMIRSAANAVLCRYIQPNPVNSKIWLSFDIDRASSPYEITEDLGLPPPHHFVQDKHTGRAHALFGMMLPVHLNADSSLAAIRFAAAVDVGLSTRLDADPNYAGLICKNPLHSDWRVWSSNSELYTLEYLAEFVELDVYRDRRKNLPEIGLGRNCTLFERTSKWSYKAIRQGWPDYDQWLIAVETRAQGYNDFAVPLHLAEVRHTARSIAKWTHRNLSPTGFSAWQAAQGRKGGIVTSERYDMAERGALGGRPSQRAEQLELVLELKAQGFDQQAIADDLGLNQSTISRWLKNS